MRLSDTLQRSAEYYHALPKVELHRHLEGSLRFETVRELARSQSMDLPTTAQLKGMVQIQEDEPLTFENFLSKFSTLRLFYRSPEIIKRITRESIEDAAADNIRYMELRFTPVALSRAQDFPLDKVMDWVIAGAQQAEQEFGVKTRLIASINRHESLALGAQVTYLAVERMQAGLVGIDIAGDEAGYSAEPFREIMDYARNQGLHICIHAGEWNKGENVAQAIATLGAERIGHGIRVFDSPQAVELALQLNTTFEVCITSNFQSGAVASIESHPVMRMIEAGLNVTLNTDDPSISNITLSDEYRLACEVLGLSVQSLRQKVLAAAEAAFLPNDERTALVASIAAEFPSG